MRARLVFAGYERASHDRQGSKCVEEAGRDEPGPQAIGLGRLAVIDFAPNWTFNLVSPIGRATGHGVHAPDVIGAVTAAGFTLQHHEPR